MELGRIQEKYDTEKRKRLRDLDTSELFDDGMFSWGGSSKLGAGGAAIFYLGAS